MKRKRLKPWINTLRDADILKGGKNRIKSRLYEVENRIFLKEFLRRMQRNDKTIYLYRFREDEGA